ncbi:MAG: hypothetical protein IPH89_14985 [Bacteroidetes bacterium]|nr:hypothetical protein [Bacteroidota bacterium]
MIQPNEKSLFEQIASLEQQHHFLDHLNERIGDAYWLYSMRHRNVETNKEIVYLPFGFYGEVGTKAILQGIRPLNSPNTDYQLQLILKSEIENYSADRYIDAYLAFAFESFDEIMYEKTPDYTFALSMQEKNQRIFPQYYTSNFSGNSNTGNNRNECDEYVIELCFKYDCGGTDGGTGGGGIDGTEVIGVVMEIVIGG